MATKQRGQNYRKEEVGLIRRMYEENESLLGSTRTDAKTNVAKQKKWKEIATAVNALGSSNRTAEDIKTKWKNMKSAIRPKKTPADNFSPLAMIRHTGIKQLYLLQRNSTGEEPEELSSSLFSPIVNNMAFQTLNASAIGIDVREGPVRDEVAVQDTAARYLTTPSPPVPSPLAPSPAPSTPALPHDQQEAPAPTNDKRQHSVTIPQQQMKVLRMEEDLSRQKMVNLKKWEAQLDLDIEIRQKQKRKLDMEIALLEKKRAKKTKKNSAESNSSVSSSEDSY